MPQTQEFREHIIHFDSRMSEHPSCRGITQKSVLCHWNSQSWQPRLRRKLSILIGSGVALGVSLLVVRPLRGNSTRHRSIFAKDPSNSSSLPPADRNCCKPSANPINRSSKFSLRGYLKLPWRVSEYVRKSWCWVRVTAT